MKEPELITIIEGPTPEFHSTPFAWAQSVQEGPVGMHIAQIELRTNTGGDIIDRCMDAWHEGRPVRLDFPDELRMRQQVDVVAMRLKEIDAGEVLMLWVREELDEEMLEALQDEEDDEDDFFGF